MTAPVLIARFRTEKSLTQAVLRLREDGIGPLWIHSPHPVAVAGTPPATVPLITLAAGLAGFFASLGLQIYADSVDYVLDIGGRPPNSWPAFIPTAFENGLLCAILAGFVAFVALSREQEPPVEAPPLDGYHLTLRPADELALDQAYERFREAHAEQILEVPS